MSHQPTLEQLAALTPLERFSFRMADLVNRWLKLPFIVWNFTLMSFLVWVAGGRRIRHEGMENLAPFDRDARIIFVANHRSFFDFFVITFLTYHNTRLPKRMIFPVRSTFFYDHPLGPLVNFAMGGMAMFPPIMRDQRKRAFNRYAMERMRYEMAHSTLLGFHPEGTRNKGPDPYTFLPTKAGVGELALKAEEATVIPVFIMGMTSNWFRELWRNWTARDAWPITVLFGAPVDVSDLRGREHTPELYQEAAERCMGAVRYLAARHRVSRLGERQAPAMEEASK